jgi:hypothetical protein
MLREINKRSGFRPRERWLAWAGVVALLLLTIGVVWLRHFNVEGGLDESQRTYPGSPIHLRRTKELIHRIATESQDDLINNLLNDDQVYFLPSVQPGILEQTDLVRCLSSRRTLRLWQVLSELPEAERVSVLRRLWEKVLAEHQATIEWSLQRELDPSVAREDGRPKPLLATKMAVIACWWMTMHIEGLSPLLNDMAQLEAYAQEVEERLAGDPRYSERTRFYVQGYLQPDNACKLNLLVLAIERHVGQAPNKADALREKLKHHGLPTSRLSLAVWNAKVGPFDTVHVYEGVGIDHTNGVKEFDLHGWGKHRFDNEFQKRVLVEIRRVAVDVVSTSN